MKFLARFFFKDIDGVELVLSGKKYIVPPMNFKTLIEITPQLKGLDGIVYRKIPTKAQLYCIAKIIHRALRRNYPFIHFSTVVNGLDMSSMGTNLTLVMSGSGAVSKGEAPAVNQ